MRSHPHTEFQRNRNYCDFGEWISSLKRFDLRSDPISGYGIPYPDMGFHIRIWDMDLDMANPYPRAYRIAYQWFVFLKIIVSGTIPDMDLIAYQSGSEKESG